MIDIVLDSNNGFDVYQFGSSIYETNPNDIDIAIIYDKSKVSIEEALDYRNEISLFIYKEYNLPADIILLNTSEEAETNFLDNAKHKVIYKNSSPYTV